MLHNYVIAEVHIYYIRTTERTCCPTQVLPGSMFVNPLTQPGSTQTNFFLEAGSVRIDKLFVLCLPSAVLHVRHLTSSL